MSDAHSQRKIRNLLLDKKFQLKYTLIMVVFATVISIALGAFLVQATRESSRVESLGVPELDAQIDAELATKDRKVLVALVIFWGMLSLSVMGTGILATHKIAGPAYSLQRSLHEVTEGKLPKLRGLRKGDELQALAEEMTHMLDALRERETAELTALKDIFAIFQTTPSCDLKVKALLESLIQEKWKRISG